MRLLCAHIVDQILCRARWLFLLSDRLFYVTQSEESPEVKVLALRSGDILCVEMSKIHRPIPAQAVK